MLIYHIATAADWRATKNLGKYEMSTLGRTLAEEGFIHAAFESQVTPTFRRFYADAAMPLLLLTIDTDKLTTPWREDDVPTEQGVERFPHILGPLPHAAVIRVQELNAHGGTESFAEVLFKEMGKRMLFVVLAMCLAGVGALIAHQIGGANLQWAGALIGLVVGGLAVWMLTRKQH